MVKLQQQFSEVLSSDQTQAEIERLKLQHYKKIEAATQFLRTQELQRGQMIQQLNQPDPEIQDGKITLENTRLVPSSSKRVPPQQVATSAFSINTPIISHVITENHKRAFFTDAVDFTENFI